MATTGTRRRKPLRRDRGVALYGPTESKPVFRVVLPDIAERTVRIDADRGSDDWDDAVAAARAEADANFDQMVRWSAQNPDKVKVTDKRRTWDELFRLHIGSKPRAARTVDKYESLWRLYIRPVVGGGSLVFRTRSGVVKDIMDRARARVGGERQRDVYNLCDALVRFAHNKAWIAPGVDLMEGATRPHSRSAPQGESDRYIPPKLRPTTDQVEALAAAMGERARQVMARRPGLDRDWGELIVLVMGKSGLRWGELNALTVDSVLGHDEGERHLKFSWTVEERRCAGGRDARLRLKALKNHRQRYTIVPASVWPMLIERAEALMERFGDELGPLALLFPEHDHDFREIEVVYPDGTVRTELRDADFWLESDFNKSMYRRAVKMADGWPDTPPFPFENLRHHFATWALDKGYPIELVSLCMGHHDPSFTYQRYVRASARSYAEGVELSAAL